MLTKKEDGKVLIFVYGTLKPGFPNSKYMPTTAAYVGAAVTTSAYPLVIHPGTRVPFMLDFPEHERAKRVHGIIFSVGMTALAFLDDFEGVNCKFYKRETISVEVTGGEAGAQPERVDVYCYLRHPAGGGPTWAQNWPEADLKELTMHAEYSKEMLQGYIPREKRQKE